MVIGSDLLPSGVDLGSVEEINSTFIGNCHQPFSNLQECEGQSEMPEMPS